MTAPPGISLDVVAGLAAQVGRLADQLAADRADRQAQAQVIATEGLRFVKLPVHDQVPVGGVIAISDSEGWSPKTGYFWAVQQWTVNGLSGSDTVRAYMGTAITQQTLALATNSQQVGPPFTVTSPNWHPGSTGLIVQPHAILSVSGGGLSGARPSVSIYVVQGRLADLHNYLM